MAEYIPYYEKLRDPRWQKKRLEIMQRDDFKCRICAAADSTLNVHHAFYVSRRDPWGYSDDSLRTLCEDCHKRWHEAQNVLLHAASYLKDHDTLEELIGFAKAFAGSLANDHCNPTTWLLANESQRRGAAYFAFLGMTVFYKMDVSDPSMADTDGLDSVLHRNPHLRAAAETDYLERMARNNTETERLNRVALHT